MALEPIALQAIIAECKDGRPRRLLSLGYPDILAKPGHFDHIDEREDSLAVKRWHNWPHRIPDTDQVFASLNIEPIYFDVAKVRGPERIVNLNSLVFESGESTYEGNRRLWEEERVTLRDKDDWGFTIGRPDIILDPGTLEHCFNIGAAWAALTEALAPRGLFIHTNPCNMGNHGFWSLQPTAYQDWYAGNGFRIEAFGILTGPVHERKFMVMEDMTKRFEAPPNSTALVVARKMKDNPPSWPIQSKYRQNPTLKGAA